MIFCMHGIISRPYWTNQLFIAGPMGQQNPTTYDVVTTYVLAGNVVAQNITSLARTFNSSYF